MSLEASDHDLLIELRTMFKMAHEENQRNLMTHQREDTKTFSELDMKIVAAHTRLDNFKREIAELIEQGRQEAREQLELSDREREEALETLERETLTPLKDKVDSFGSLKDRVLGGSAVIGVLFGIIMTLVAIYH